jgi:hypothetical protein
MHLSVCAADEGRPSGLIEHTTAQSAETIRSAARSWRERPTLVRALLHLLDLPDDSAERSESLAMTARAARGGLGARQRNGAAA